MPTSQRPRGRLAFAIAASFAVHFVLALSVRDMPQARADAEPTPTISLETPAPIAIVTPRPTPTPTPAPRLPHPVRTPVAVVARPAAAPHAVVRPPHTSASAVGPSVPAARGGDTTVAGGPPGDGGGDGVAPVPAIASTPTATPTPVPTATATPKLTCAKPQADARTITALEPETPAIARERGATGVTSVRVDLSATGVVTGTTVAHSSGDQSLDAAALDAARRSTYAPEVVDCTAVPGSYLFRVEFDAG